MTAAPALPPNDLPPPVPSGRPGEETRAQPGREVVPLARKKGGGPPIPPLAVTRDEKTTSHWLVRYLGRSDPLGGIISLLFHVGLLVALAFLVFAKPPGADRAGTLVGSFQDSTQLTIDELEYEIQLSDTTQLVDSVAMNAATPTEIPLTLDTLLGKGEAPSVGSLPLSSKDLLQSPDSPGGGLQGRTAQARADAIGTGPTGESEGAVERGLNWLAAHQAADGSWNFDHRKGPCKGQCSGWATVENEHSGSTTAATAIALAPFLGAGYTHLVGPHQETVRQGLYHLVQKAMVTSRGTDLRDGSMYGQGLAALVLCEAYEMTDDPGLRAIAQGSLDFIDRAQDKRGGGWRYTLGEPGDTTITGWQYMALKSGRAAGLDVDTATLYLIGHFLDSVESDEGAQYGYTDHEPGRTTTAIGLLCRMYGGWRWDHPALERGVNLLYEWGPSEEDLYYNYYAAQVLHHVRGPRWEAWNKELRDFLVATQSKAGHENGSWYFPMHAETGGRLYNTAMAIMTLEVYYRYMPIYQSTD